MCIRDRNINIGMAAALPSGNLIVPVIHNADAVSYTHLDVYKRQVVCGCFNGSEAGTRTRDTKEYSGRHTTIKIL